MLWRAPERNYTYLSVWQVLARRGHLCEHYRPPGGLWTLEIDGRRWTHADEHQVVLTADLPFLARLALLEMIL